MKLEVKVQGIITVVHFATQRFTYIGKKLTNIQPQFKVGFECVVSGVVCLVRTPRPLY